jgi:hypothetical protein
VPQAIPRPEPLPDDWALANPDQALALAPDTPQELGWNLALVLESTDNDELLARLTSTPALPTAPRTPSRYTVRVAEKMRDLLNAHVSEEHKALRGGYQQA